MLLRVSQLVTGGSPIQLVQIPLQTRKVSAEVSFRSNEEFRYAWRSSGGRSMLADQDGKKR